MADRILQALRPRKDGVLLRENLRALGSPSQLSVALRTLVQDGLLVRLKRGVYAKPAMVAECGATALLAGVTAKQHQKLVRARKQRRRLRQQLTPTARWVAALARKNRVDYRPTYADQFAASATRLAGDCVQPDATDDLLVALRREGKISESDFLMHVMAHHRALKHV